MLTMKSFCILIIPGFVASFFFNGGSRGVILGRSTTRSFPLRLTPEEIRAEAMAGYFARVDEEKKQSISQLEAKYQIEIASLKNEIAQLRNPSSRSTSTSSDDATNLDREELLQLVKHYRDYLATYVVSSHEQKIQAIKAAEMELNIKWESKLKELALFDNHLYVKQQETGSPATNDLHLSDHFFYKARNNMIKAAAVVGKTRWGALEISRVETNAKIGNEGTKVPVDKSSSSIPLPSPPSIPIRSWQYLNTGSVVGQESQAIVTPHGLSTSEVIYARSPSQSALYGSRNVMELDREVSHPGSTRNEKSVGSMPSAPFSLYSLRNEKVVTEAGAGLSRWGPMEINRIMNLMSGTVPSVTKSHVLLQELIHQTCSNSQIYTDNPTPTETFHHIEIVNQNSRNAVSNNSEPGNLVNQIDKEQTWIRPKRRNQIIEAAAWMSRWVNRNLHKNINTDNAFHIMKKRQIPSSSRSHQKTISMKERVNKQQR